VVENLPECRYLSSRITADFDELFTLGHGRVRSLRHQRVELADFAPFQNLCGQGKQNVGIVIAGLVSHDCEDR